MCATRNYGDMIKLAFGNVDNSINMSWICHVTQAHSHPYTSPFEFYHCRREFIVTNVRDNIMRQQYVEHFELFWHECENGSTQTDLMWNLYLYFIQNCNVIFVFFFLREMKNNTYSDDMICNMHNISLSFSYESISKWDIKWRCVIKMS